MLVKINVALAAALRRLDPATLGDDARRFLEFMEYIALPPSVAAGGAGPGRIDLERLSLVRDPQIERLLVLYRHLPDRERSILLTVVEALSRTSLG